MQNIPQRRQYAACVQGMHKQKRQNLKYPPNTIILAPKHLYKYHQ